MFFETFRRCGDVAKWLDSTGCQCESAYIVVSTCQVEKTKQFDAWGMLVFFWKIYVPSLKMDENGRLKPPGPSIMGGSRDLQGGAPENSFKKCFKTPLNIHIN